MQVSGLTVAGIDRTVDETQRVVEAGDQLRSDHVLFERFLWFRDPFGEVQDKIALADTFREVRDFGDEFVGHGGRSTKSHGGSGLEMEVQGGLWGPRKIRKREQFQEFETDCSLNDRGQDVRAKREDWMLSPWSEQEMAL